MLYSIWSNGTWPGPSIIDLARPCVQARSVSSPRVSSSRELGRVGRVGEAAGAAGRRRCENVTSYSRMISQISSQLRVHRGSRLLCTSIHLARQRAAAADDADQASL